MTYRSLVIKMLTIDMAMILILGSFVIYAAISAYKETDKDVVLGAKLLSVFFGIVLIMSVSSSYTRISDYVSYIVNGDNYTRETTCIIRQYLRSAVGGLFGDESFVCANGEKFYVRYTFRYRRWLWRQVGREVRIIYLPRSHTVVEIRGKDAP